MEPRARPERAPVRILGPAEPARVGQAQVEQVRARVGQAQVQAVRAVRARAVRALVVRAPVAPPVAAPVSEAREPEGREPASVSVEAPARAPAAPVQEQAARARDRVTRVRDLEARVRDPATRAPGRAAWAWDGAARAQDRAVRVRGRATGVMAVLEAYADWAPPDRAAATAARREVLHPGPAHASAPAHPALAWPARAEPAGRAQSARASPGRAGPTSAQPARADGALVAVGERELCSEVAAGRVAPGVGEGLQWGSRGELPCGNVGSVDGGNVRCCCKSGGWQEGVRLGSGVCGARAGGSLEVLFCSWRGRLGGVVVPDARLGLSGSDLGRGWVSSCCGERLWIPGEVGVGPVCVPGPTSGRFAPGWFAPGRPGELPGSGRVGRGVAGLIVVESPSERGGSAAAVGARRVRPAIAAASASTRSVRPAMCAPSSSGRGLAPRAAQLIGRRVGGPSLARAEPAAGAFPW